MREPTIARNYAEALFELGERLGATDRFADLMAGLASAMAADRRIRVALESPRVPRHTKERMLESALVEVAPAEFLRFLAAVIKRGRQHLLPHMERQFSALVDTKHNRVHVGVTMARTPDEALRNTVAARLQEATGKEVIPHFREDPGILGGVILRLGDRILDGSVRRRMMRLRRQLLSH